MKKILFRFLIYCSLLFIVLAVSHTINLANLKELNTDTLPPDFENSIYSVSTVYMDSTQKGYVFSISDTLGHSEAILSIVDATSFTLFQNGELLYTYQRSDPYQKVIQIPIVFAQGEKTNTFFFSSPEWAHALSVNPLGLTIPKIKILIGGADYSRHYLAKSYGINMFMLGLLLLLSFGSLYLFCLKKSHDFLLLMFFVALISAFHIALSSPIALVPLKNELYLKMRMPIVVSLLIPNAGLPLCLVKNRFPDKIRRLFNTKMIMLATVISILLQIIMPFSIYHILRWGCMLSCAFLLIRYLDNSSQTFILLGAVACCFGSYFFVYCTSTLHLFPSCALMAFNRFTEIGYFLSLLLNYLIVLRKYSDKFVEAEHLNVSLLAANEKLENAVTIAKNELNQEQRKRHDMMMNIFHDIRSPLFVVQGYLDKIIDDQSELTRLLPTIRDELQFIARLQDDLYYLSCYETKELMLDFTPCDSSELIESALSDCHLSASAKKIELINRTCDHCMIWCDVFHIRRVFRNIINNAIRHTPQGGNIYIETQKTESHIYIRFTDTGSGILESELARVFDRYYRGVHSHTNDDSQGLGLSIAQEIVNEHRGTICARNIDGKGAQIEIMFPILQGAFPQSE